MRLFPLTGILDVPRDAVKRNFLPLRLLSGKGLNPCGACLDPFSGLLYNKTRCCHPERSEGSACLCGQQSVAGKADSSGRPKASALRMTTSAATALYINGETALEDQLQSE